MMALAFGIGFLSPVLIVFLQLVGIVQPRTLVKQWRYAVMGIFVVAAVITPSGDPFSLFVLAVPMTVLYVVAVWCWLARLATSQSRVGRIRTLHVDFLKCARGIHFFARL